MTATRSIHLLALCLFALLGGCAVEYGEGGGAETYEPTAAGMELLFAERCDNCHGYAPGQGELELPGDVLRDLDSGMNALVVPGDPDGSYLYQRLVDGDMPPGNRPLPPVMIEAVRMWIARGAEQ